MLGHLEVFSGTVGRSVGTGGLLLLLLGTTVTSQAGYRLQLGLGTARDCGNGNLDEIGLGLVKLRVAL